MATSVKDNPGNLGENSSNRLLNVYPNPTKQGEQIALSLDNYNKKEKVTVTLHDVTGRIVLTQSFITNNQGEVKTVVSVPSSIKSGVYILKSVGGSGTRQQKLVIQ